MDSTDPLKQEVLDVRKVIEKSTSKVSLRDLEKKGFRQVKVLRAGDINQLIFKAVQNVLAKQPRGAGGMTEEEKQKVLSEAKAEVDRQLAETRRAAAEAQRIEEEKGRIEEARKRLEEKVAELNRQMLAEKKAFTDEKKAFEREKQALFEKGLAGQEAAARQYEGQVSELRQRIDRGDQRVEAAESRANQAETRASVAEARAEAAEARARAAEARANGAVPQAEYDRLRERFERLENDLEAAEQKAREARAALAEAESNSGTGAVSATLDAELQRMRFEIEQRDSSMRDLITGLATSLQTVQPGAPGQSGEIDMSKQFKQLQLSISDQIRKSIGAGGKGGGLDFDLTPEAAAALFAGQADVKLEANEVTIKEQKGGGVADKLNKLKRMKGK